VSLVGSGAANVATLRLLIASGVQRGNVYVCDSQGILHPGRRDIEARKIEFVDKWRICQMTNAEGRTGGPAEAMHGTDVCIALSKPGPGTILPEWVAGMGRDAIIFPAANPIPEIWPWEAKEAGARIVGTGRSDFPNQVNNSLGFPGIFRGTLDVMATTITDEMCIAAAEEMARVAEDKGLREDYLIPTMDEWEVFPREAVAVGQKAIEQGVARRMLTPKKAYNIAADIIKEAREEIQCLMKQGFIKMGD